MLTRDELQRAQDYAYVFGSEQGQRVLEDLEKSFSFHTTAWVGDPNELIFREGGRAVVLRIRRIIELLRSGELEKPGAGQYFDPATDGDNDNG